MNYYQPRKRESDGRYDFTCLNDGKTWAVGYCTKFREWWKSDSIRGFPVSQKEIDAEILFKDKYHIDGHATYEQAGECYKEYLLDHRLKLGRKMTDQKLKCEVCGEWTSLFATLGDSEMWTLCQEHNTREEVEKLFETPSLIISS